MMRISKSILLAGVTAMVLVSGCAGPEQKLGRGVRNMTEFSRLGEIRNSMEQTALWESPERSYTTGFIKGFNQSVKRTAIGVYEVVTFPFPNYEPVGVTDEVIYPENYKAPAWPRHRCFNKPVLPCWPKPTQHHNWHCS
jgi:putative exosortase-associated protein (TIGR04073 family)